MQIRKEPHSFIARRDRTCRKVKRYFRHAKAGWWLLLITVCGGSLSALSIPASLGPYSLCLSFLLFFGGLGHFHYLAQQSQNKALIRAKRRRKKLILGRFLDKGEQIKKKIANGDATLLTVEVANWSKEVEEFLLTELDPSYVARFRSMAGQRSVLLNITNKENRHLWIQIDAKLVRLRDFISEHSIR